MRFHGRFVGAAITLVAGMHCLPARADEGGASVYLLGSGAPDAAVLPPLPGVFLDNSIYIYDGGTGGTRDLVIGGKIVSDVDATLAANFTTLLWVPNAKIAGGTLAIGGAFAFGGTIVDAAAVITGPAGRTLDIRGHDSAFVVGDPIVSASLGWKFGKLHVAASSFVNIPVGHYREGQLANLSFHRWAGDVSLATSWHDEESGWDISGKAGVTFNGRNAATDYNSGNDLHLEASAGKTLGKKFSAAVFGYQFVQISGDTGSGAKLGPYRGEVTGLGGTVAYSDVFGRVPTTLRLRVAQEFWAKNRPSGTAVMFSVTLPLSMKTPGQ